MQRLTTCISALLVALSVPSESSAQSLPQGLTCGLSYREQSCNPIGTDCSESVPEDNTCNGVHTAAPISKQVTCHCQIINGTSNCYDTNNHPTSNCDTPCDGATLTCLTTVSTGTEGNAATGYTNVVDGDVGENSFFGYRHQELVGGETNVSLADSFSLPEGAVCGFHHTGNSPGRTCMGYNPSRAFADITNDTAGLVGCPPGWMARRAFDMSSGSQYWTWCEYADPKNLSPGHAMPYEGVDCGLSLNNGPPAPALGSCMRYATTTASATPACPGGTSSSSWIDMGRPDNIGLGFCTVGTTLLPQPMNCSPGLSWCQSNSACADLQTDHNHCGACGVACGVGESCQAGLCFTDGCPAGTTDCCGDGSLCRSSCANVSCQ